MRWKLLILAAVLPVLPLRALADSNVPSLPAATTLSGATSYVANGGATNNSVGYTSSVFDIATGALTLKAGGVSDAMLASTFMKLLTTTGTTGAASLSSGTLNIPQYQGALTLTTTGSSGAATLAGNTLNIPQYSGGGSVSVTAGTPNIVITPSPGTGTFTVGGTNPQNTPADGGSHSYTFVSGDATKEVDLASTFTAAALPQAIGSFGAGWATTACTTSAITVTSTTSTINGIAGATGIKIGANQCFSPSSDGTNWKVALGVPQCATQTGTTFIRDDMTCSAPAGAGTVTNAANLTNHAPVIGDGGTTGVKTTAAMTNGQILVGATGADAAPQTMSQDCTLSSAGVITCTKTNNVSFGALATTTPGTGVTTAAAANLSAAGGLTSTIASGTSALGTSAISSATCATVVTTVATNTATTDVVLASFNGDPTAVTGYIPATTGMLTIIAYPTSGNVNFKVCNNTSGSITPGAITLNWRVVR